MVELPIGRTSKLMAALSSVPYIVTTDWLIDSASELRFLNAQPYCIQGVGQNLPHAQALITSSYYPLSHHRAVAWYTVMSFTNIGFSTGAQLH